MSAKQYYCTRMFIRALVSVTRKPEKAQVFINERVGKPTWYIYAMEYHSVNGRKCLL